MEIGAPPGENPGSATVRHHFPVHKWNTLTSPLSRYCSTQWGHTGMQQVFTFAHVGWWNIVQVRMLHRANTVTSSNHQFKRMWGRTYLV